MRKEEQAVLEDVRTALMDVMRASKVCSLCLEKQIAIITELNKENSGRSAEKKNTL